MLINQFCIVWRKNADEDMAIASAALEIFLIKKVLISARPPPPPPQSPTLRRRTEQNGRFPFLQGERG